MPHADTGEAVNLQSLALKMNNVTIHRLDVTSRQPRLEFFFSAVFIILFCLLRFPFFLFVDGVPVLCFTPDA